MFLGDLFWNVATSASLLGVDGLLLLAAGVVGWAPLLSMAPLVAPYVKAARLVAVLVALVMAFLLGARVMDEREAAKNLRVRLATVQHDLEATQRAHADDLEQSTRIEGNANAQHALDQAYIASLQTGTGCGFDPGPVSPKRVRVQPIGSFRFSIFGRAKARSAGGAGPDESPSVSGAAACGFPWYGVQACRGLDPAAMLRLTVSDDREMRSRLKGSRAWYENVRRDYGGKQ